jgi:hypothetical protein
MSINLSDIPNAVADYLNTHVESIVTEVVPDVSGSLQPGEGATFTVKATNAAAPDGVRLVNVKHHLRIPTISPSSQTVRAKLRVPTTPPARATTDPNDPVLAANLQVAEMFLFPLDPVLEVGDTDTIVGLRINALSVGSAEITCHIHADIDRDDMFPNGENNPTGTRQFSVT